MFLPAAAQARPGRPRRVVAAPLRGAVPDLVERVGADLRIITRAHCYSALTFPVTIGILHTNEIWRGAMAEGRRLSLVGKRTAMIMTCEESFEPCEYMTSGRPPMVHDGRVAQNEMANVPGGDNSRSARGPKGG